MRVKTTIMTYIVLVVVGLSLLPMTAANPANEGEHTVAMLVDATSMDDVKVENRSTHAFGQRALQDGQASVCVLPADTAGYAFSTPPSLGLPDLGLPDLGLPGVVPATVSSLGSVTCAPGSHGSAAVSCIGIPIGFGATDTTTMTGIFYGNKAYQGIALGPDGKLYSAPQQTSDAVLIIDPELGTADTTTMANLDPDTDWKWFGTVLGPTGKLF
eukprot:COSAG06_NODE_23180_length_700_cov_1.196339_1_plen_213_part_01